MDEKLEHVLHQVKLLCEQNPEFKEALKKKLNISIAVSQNNVDSSQIEKIERYLGLDYKLDNIAISDSVYSCVDYSFISVSSVRDMLVSDYREMLRYRFGTRSHKADFYEFCKYAHFQLEALANEFVTCYSLIEDSEDDEVDIETAKDFIRNNWPPSLNQPIFRDNIKEVKDIDYFQKITAIITYLKIDSQPIYSEPHILHSLSDVINNIRRIRNDISHRGPQQEQEINNSINLFEKKIYQSTIGDKELYKFSDIKVKDYLWRRMTPWDDVVKVLSILCKSMSAVMS